MATYDLTVGGNGGLSFASARTAFVLEREVDFAATNYAGTDVLQLIDIPAKTLVLTVVSDVVTAEGGTLTYDVGDGSDPDGFIDGANGNSVGTTASSLALTEGAPNTITGYSGGKFYAAADTLDMVINNAADAAKIRVRALCFDLSDSGDLASV